MAEEPVVLGDRTSNWTRFIGRVLIVTIVAIVVALIWFATRVFLLAFIGILIGLLFWTLATSVQRHSPLSYAWSLALVMLLFAIALTGMAWLIGEQLVSQLSQLSQRVPQSWSEIQKQLGNSQWGRWIEGQISIAPRAIGRQDLLSQFTSALSSLMAFLAGVVVVLFVGFYLAASPRWYEDGVVQLAPLEYRERLRLALRKTAAALRWWLLAQLVAMIVVGVATGVGLWLVGIPLALSLGLLAFILEVVPNLGPVLAAIPALIIAWTQGTTELMLVLLVYFVVQGLEVKWCSRSCNRKQSGSRRR